jgi:hypothetical protein
VRQAGASATIATMAERIASLTNLVFTPASHKDAGAALRQCSSVVYPAYHLSPEGGSPRAHCLSRNF